MSDHETENSSSASVISEEVAQQIRAVVDPVLQQLHHICKSMCEMKNKQAKRPHEETASFRGATSLSGSGSRSENDENFRCSGSSH